MKSNKSFALPAVLRTITSATGDENHGMWSLQFGELPTFRSVVGKLVVGAQLCLERSQIAYHLLSKLKIAPKSRLTHT